MYYQSYQRQAGCFRPAMQYAGHPQYPVYYKQYPPVHQYLPYQYRSYPQYLPSHQYPQYPVRHDRVMPVNGENAQSVYPPAACVFVGNILTNAPVARLGADLEAVFGAFGPCHAKVSQGKKKLRTAFVQFHTVGPAAMARAEGDHGQIWMHGRQLRVEKAKGIRTMVIGHKTGADLPWKYLYDNLSSFGALEAWGTGSAWNPSVASKTTTAVATFAYVDDCKNAEKAFFGSPEFWVELREIEDAASDGSKTPREAPSAQLPDRKPASRCFSPVLEQRTYNEAEKRYLANGGCTLSQYAARREQEEQEAREVLKQKAEKEEEQKWEEWWQWGEGKLQW